MTRTPEILIRAWEKMSSIHLLMISFVLVVVGDSSMVIFFFLKNAVSFFIVLSAIVEYLNVGTLC